MRECDAESACAGGGPSASTGYAGAAAAGPELTSELVPQGGSVVPRDVTARIMNLQRITLKVVLARTITDLLIKNYLMLRLTRIYDPQSSTVE